MKLCKRERWISSEIRLQPLNDRLVFCAESLEDVPVSGRREPRVIPGRFGIRDHERGPVMPFVTSALDEGPDQVVEGRSGVVCDLPCQQPPMRGEWIENTEYVLAGLWFELADHCAIRILLKRSTRLVIGNDPTVGDPKIAAQTVVTGGVHNIADAYSSVLGGDENTASNTSTASGGYKNEATGELASVSGGYRNKATSTESSVLGGKKIKFDTQYGVSP